MPIRLLETVGERVGIVVGTAVLVAVGAFVVGANVGGTVGSTVGFFHGAFVGEVVWAFVGEVVGAFVGEVVDAADGEVVGAFVGASSGAAVTGEASSSASVTLSEASAVKTALDGPDIAMVPAAVSTLGERPARSPNTKLCTLVGKPERVRSKSASSPVSPIWDPMAITKSSSTAELPLFSSTTVVALVSTGTWLTAPTVIAM